MPLETSYLISHAISSSEKQTISVRASGEARRQEVEFTYEAFVEISRSNVGYKISIMAKDLAVCFSVEMGYST